MPFVVGKWWYPSHKAEEVTKIFQSLEQTERVGESVVFANKGSKNGVIGMSIFKVSLEDVGQAMAEMATILSNYAVVEGYEADVEAWADLTAVPG
jgi:hypothetical protein